MINTKDLSKKPLQDLLRDKVWLMDYMKRIATKIGIDVTTGKWMYKFRSTELKDPVLPKDFPNKCGKLLEILDIYITCKEYNQPVQSTTLEEMLFCEFRALEKKYLEKNQT